MEQREIIEKVQDVARSVIENDEIVLDYSTTTDQVEGWDSLNHVQIVSEIQDLFDIKFSAKEMISWESIGDLCETIRLKLK